MAGAGVALGGPVVSAASSNGVPSPYLPGTQIRDPTYVAKKAAYDTAQRQRESQIAATQRGQTSFLSAANHNANYSASHYDPETGLQLNYPGNGSGNGNGAGAHGPLEPENRMSLEELLRDSGKVSPPIVVPNAPQPVLGPDRASRLAANEAAYGAAKAKVGVQGRASLNALHSQMGERGIAGSGIEGALTGGIIAAGQHDLADTVLGQTGADLNREQAVEDRNYAGGISQRGQDFEGRAQDIGAQEANAAGRRQSIEQLFRMRSGRAGGRLY
jgi:hypothetical protein